MGAIFWLLEPICPHCKFTIRLYCHIQLLKLALNYILFLFNYVSSNFYFSFDSHNPILKVHFSVSGWLMTFLYELWLFRPFAGSPPGWFAPCAWLIRPLACSPPPVEYTGDSLLRLVFQFTERQQTSIASRYWLIVTSINVLSNWIDHSSQSQ